MLLKSIAVVVLCPLSLTAFATELPKELKARYAWEKKVIEARDLNAFKMMISKDYVSIGPDGSKSTAEQMLAAVAPMFKATKISMKENFPKVVKKGANYDVSYDAELQMTYKDGKSELYKEVGIDTWKKINNEWLIVKSVVKKATTTTVK